MKRIGLLPLTSKTEQLAESIRSYRSLAVAFSGGVDSVFLLAAAAQILPDSVAAVISVSSIHAERERQSAIAFLKRYNFRYRSLDSDELKLAEFVANSKDRCYYCKYALFSQIIDIARNSGITQVAHGANTDDLDEERPGFKAAEALGVVAPLIVAGLTKNDIRQYSWEMGLPTWNKPSMACLATRIPTGTMITQELLTMVEAGEETLYLLGFQQIRVRIHDKTARIEVAPAEIDRLLSLPIRTEIITRFNRIGFEHVAVDLKGYARKIYNKPIISGG